MVASDRVVALYARAVTVLLARSRHRFLPEKSEAFSVFSFITLGAGGCIWGYLLIILLAACRYTTAKGEKVQLFCTQKLRWPRCEFKF